MAPASPARYADQGPRGRPAIQPKHPKQGKQPPRARSAAESGGETAGVRSPPRPRWEGIKAGRRDLGAGEGEEFEGWREGGDEVEGGPGEDDEAETA